MSTKWIPCQQHQHQDKKGQTRKEPGGHRNLAHALVHDHHTAGGEITLTTRAGGGPLAQGRQGLGHLEGQDPDPDPLHQRDPIHVDPILAPDLAHGHLVGDSIDHKEETQVGEEEEEEDMNATVEMQGEETTMTVVDLVEEVVEVAAMVVAVVVEVVLGMNRPSEADHQAVNQESQTSGARRW